MNKDLREICNAVKKYGVLLSEDSEKLKQNHKQYLDDIENLKETINSHLDKTANLFETCCYNSQFFYQQPTNIFKKIKRYICSFIVNHKLNKYLYELFVYGTLQNNLNTIHKKLMQYHI